MSISSTEEIVAELRAGRMVILVDEEDRENEGDLVLAADFVTPEAINFMIRHARGLVCLTLTEMAGLSPASVICEIIKEDGTMARLPDLLEFGKEHNIKIGTIADLIHYRSQTESLVERVAERPLSTVHGEFRLVAFRDKPSGCAHLALVHGEPAQDEEALVRVHQPVSIIDLLDNGSTTHSWNLASSMQAIKAAKAGVIVLLNCSETAEQLFGQFQDKTAARPNARAAGLDLRTYGIGAQVLKLLGVRRMKLLANPRKMPSMTGFDLEVTGYLAKPEA
ncbi:MAG: bifunctional 3,4-dihydroxy-2-butanone-4-phosphate synthase/GTP cyclohydrolase II [Oxalobacteraceae bacterium]|nr:MAG: bifunctional 3,4-dihydroxy-2-butanone-4-phosphate synthase/GTP cyclohydrolase II [Oxalobacteraceae bacterium]